MQIQISKLNTHTWVHFCVYVIYTCTSHVCIIVSRASGHSRVSTQVLVLASWMESTHSLVSTQARATFSGSWNVSSTFLVWKLHMVGRLPYIMGAYLGHYDNFVYRLWVATVSISKLWASPQKINILLDKFYFYLVLIGHDTLHGIGNESKKNTTQRKSRVAVVKSTKTRVVVMKTNTRRHPYIAFITRSSADENKWYQMPPSISLPSLPPRAYQTAIGGKRACNVHRRRNPTCY